MYPSIQSDRGGVALGHLPPEVHDEIVNARKEGQHLFIRSIPPGEEEKNVAIEIPKTDPLDGCDPVRDEDLVDASVLEDEFSDRCITMTESGQPPTQKRPGRCVQERYHVWRWIGWRHPPAGTMCHCGELPAPWMKR